MSDLRRTPVLVIKHGPHCEETRPLESAIVTIGRAETNDLCLPDDRVSREHCKIVQADDGHFLVDTGSENGCRVNGVRVKKRRLLPGDVIVIGSTEIKFLTEEPVPAPAEEPVAPRDRPKPVAALRPTPQRRLAHATYFLLLSALFAMIVVTDFSWDRGGFVGDYWGDRFSRKPASQSPVVERKKKIDPPQAEKKREQDEEPEPVAERIPDREAPAPIVNKETPKIVPPPAPIDWRAREEERFLAAHRRALELAGKGEFAQARNTYEPFLDSPYPDIRQRAESGIAALEAEIERFFSGLPARRETIVRFLLVLHPTLAVREYDKAVAEARSLAKKEAYAAVAREIDEEIARIEAVKAIFVTLDREGTLLTGQKIAFTVTTPTRRLVEGKVEGIEKGILKIGVGGGYTGYPLAKIAGGDILRLADPSVDPMTAAAFLLAEGEFDLLQERLDALMQGAVQQGKEDDLGLIEFFERSAMVKTAVEARAVADGVAAMKRLLAANDPQKALEIQEQLEARHGRSEPYVRAAKEIGEIVRKAQDREIFDKMRTIEYAQVALLRNPDKSPAEKEKALNALKVLAAKDRKIRGYVAAALGDPSSKVRAAACRVLGDCGTKEEDVLWKLVELLQDPVGEVQVDAMAAIQTIGAKPLLPILKEKAKSPDEKTRLGAVTALGCSGEKEAAGMLVPALKDASWEIRKTAAVGLVRLGAKTSAGAIDQAFRKEQNNEVKVALVYALGAFGYASATEAIFREIDKEPYNPNIADYLKALGEMKDDGIKKKMLTYLAHPDQWVRNSALIALKNSEAKIKLEDVKPLLVDAFWLNRVIAIELLGNDPKAYGTLVLMMDDESSEVRYAAGMALANAPDKGVLKAIVENLDALQAEGLAQALTILKTLTGAEVGDSSLGGGELKRRWEKWMRENYGNYRLPQ